MAYLPRPLGKTPDGMLVKPDWLDGTRPDHQPEHEAAVTTRPRQKPAASGGLLSAFRRTGARLTRRRRAS
ncbi:MAG TPA: hypothetical protein VGS19_37190 [Streptosporangiaceae bacterium]|nr:hypothetical protein [Streptosporangiaceae bacterium]